MWIEVLYHNRHLYDEGKGPSILAVVKSLANILKKISPNNQEFLLTGGYKETLTDTCACIWMHCYCTYSFYHLLVIFRLQYSYCPAFLMMVISIEVLTIRHSPNYNELTVEKISIYYCNKMCPIAYKSVYIIFISVLIYGMLCKTMCNILVFYILFFFLDKIHHNITLIRH